MTENCTSQAVYQWIVDMKAIQACSMIPQQLKENLAIAEKYKRMESAIRRAIEKSGFYSGTDYVAIDYDTFEELEASLSFDPLSGK